MIVDNNEFENDHITIKISLHEQPEVDVIKSLKDHFRARIRVAPDIVICTDQELKKICFPEINRKPVKFIDNRKNK